MTRYRNKWHRPGKSEYGPEFYETDARATEYRGYLIYQRIKGSVWDVVKDGVCVRQMAGPNGARQAVDAFLSVPLVQAARAAIALAKSQEE